MQILIEHLINENPDCWSNAPLETADFSDLYQKPCESDVIEILKLAKLGHLL